MADNEFVPFPEARVRQIEQIAQNKEPYNSPHLPVGAKRNEGNKPRVSAANMQTNIAGLDVQPVQQRPRPAAPPPAALPTMVENEAPVFEQGLQDPEAVGVDLPSRFAFYDFKDLYVKPFKGLHLAKLSRAKEEGSTLIMVEVVSSVLSNSRGDTNLGFKLTLPDFYFVLYWLRLNSFTKSVFIHESTCTNQKHIERVTAGELNADTLKMAEVIRKSSLKTNMLDEIPNPEKFALSYPGLACTPATMQGVIEMTEHPSFRKSEEFVWAAQIAVYLKAAMPMLVGDMVRMVEDMSPDDIDTVKDYEVALGEYGIEEKIKVVCKGCGTSKEDKIQLDVHSFFPVK